MPETHPNIENLMKVTLDIEAEDLAAGSGNKSFQFVYGVGPDGITPFEKALFGKVAGDRVRLEIAPTEYLLTVGHLAMPLREQTGITSPAGMQVTITDVVKARDREVVQAMAAGGGCSDCDCGCGGH
jgi:hypothetical protein